MKYSYLGKTGMKVPVLSFGASSLGGVFHSVREAEAIRAQCCPKRFSIKTKKRK